jgi:hypothetical protein
MLASVKSPEAIISGIHKAFGANAYPGDPFLVGSREGCEPGEVAAAFAGRTDWRALDAAYLDTHYHALSFFSEAAFRFFLPAYLIADLKGQLMTADPVFHLTHGFHQLSVVVPGSDREFVRRSGGRILLNPPRYGAMTWEDHARFRLSVFTREEVAAIVSYLDYKGATDEYSFERPAIDAALKAFWLDRAERAPTSADLVRHCEEEQRFVDDLARRSQKPAE